MKIRLSILLIILLFDIVPLIIGEQADVSNEILLNEKDMKKFEKSFKKLQRFLRNLEESTGPQSEDEIISEPSEESSGVESSWAESSGVESSGEIEYTVPDYNATE